MIEKKQFIYRLLDDRNNVLYIGQHTGIHPGARVAQHKDRPWWPEVERWDFEEVLGNLKGAEQDLITFWGAYYNKENLSWRTEIEAESTIDLIFDAGAAAGSYEFNGSLTFAGHLKLIRTVLWRRDKTVVPRGNSLTWTATDFDQDWDFADFPVPSPTGFIRSMGSFGPIDPKAPQPECGFELECLPAISQDRREAWENWAEHAMREGRTLSFTGMHNQPVESEPT